VLVEAFAAFAGSVPNPATSTSYLWPQQAANVIGAKRWATISISPILPESLSAHHEPSHPLSRY